MSSRYWMELTAADLAGIAENCLAVLPVAAVEQHGPDMPVGTDAIINQGIVARTVEMLAPTTPCLFLPPQTIGASQEHLDYAGTLSHPAPRLMDMWARVLDCAVHSGIRRVLVFNSHGGNAGLLAPAALDQRVRHGVLAAYATWFDAGYPDGLFSDDEIRFGFHGGAIETSLMLHLRPELVKTQRLADYPSRAATIEAATRQLSANAGAGRMGGLGWKSQDLNPYGVEGDARDASAEKGRILLDHIAARLVELIVDLTGNGALPQEDIAQELVPAHRRSRDFPPRDV